MRHHVQGRLVDSLQKSFVCKTTHTIGQKNCAWLISGVDQTVYELLIVDEDRSIYIQQSYILELEFYFVFVS